MKDIVSKDVKNIEISGIRKFYNEVQKFPDAISLTLGQPDFAVPEKIRDAMIDAINSGKTGYTSNAGIVQLRREIGKFLKKYNMNYDENEICITVGGSEGIASVLRTIIDAGDKILIPDPGYPAYENCIKLCGGKPLYYNFNKDFSINIEDLKKTIKEYKPKAIVLSFPSNPTGAVLSEDDSKKIHDIIKNNDITAVSDEIYSELCFDKYYSPAQSSDIKNKVILVGGFSKMFSMTGLRVGYVCADKYIIDNLVKVHQYNVSCAPSISQWGAYEGLRKCAGDVEHMKEEFIKRRDYVYGRLSKIGFDVELPKGAFYIFPSIKKFGLTSQDFCMRLLNEAKVAVVPGDAFGKNGEGFIRISYSYSMENLKESIDRIENWINKI